jgi:tetracycline 7-halogenase / FADH2 O2-dependent halogenase
MREAALSERYDIAVIGSGFAGSLLAMIARRLGRRVILLERGKHPRTVIGESSTPLSNLLLEELATKYDLPTIRPLCKWGSWQTSHPELACGLKRGFSFFHHEPDCIAGVIGRENQLLVAASPHDMIADTHWYRADFDEFLVNEAQRMGIDYLDEIELSEFMEAGLGITLKGTQKGSDVEIEARFVVDATGPRGFLHNILKLGERALPDFPTTQALYSHFDGVQRLDETDGVALGTEQPPYSIDDAAVHHTFDDGWIWVLRFNNGITSAGIAATNAVAERLQFSDGRKAWERLLHQFPILKEQFAASEVVQPFRHILRLAFCSAAISGRNWALLPSAAGFVDPLLSTGFPLTLLGIARLGEILERDWEMENFAAQLERYSAQTDAELLATARLIGALYANIGDFTLFASLSMLYFVAATYSETVRRLGKPQLALSFLLHDHPEFGPASASLLERARSVRHGRESEELIKEVYRVIEPFDVAGLGNRGRRNWYPVDAEDLLSSAYKVGASRDEITQMLDRSGFYPATLRA